MSARGLQRTRRIRATAYEPAFGRTFRVTCDDGRRLTVDTAAGIVGMFADAVPHLSPGGEARVVVDAKGRIQGVGHPDARIHPLTLDIAERALGMDRDAILAWCASPLLWRTASVPAPPLPMGMVEGGDGEMTLMVSTAGWSIGHDAISLRTRLPDAVLAACAGRPLEEVARIPELSGIGVVVLSAEDTPFGTEMRVIPREGMIRFDAESPDHQPTPTPSTERTHGRP